MPLITPFGLTVATAFLLDSKRIPTCFRYFFFDACLTPVALIVFDLPFLTLSDVLTGLYFFPALTLTLTALWFVYLPPFVYACMSFDVETTLLFLSRATMMNLYDVPFLTLLPAILLNDFELPVAAASFFGLFALPHLLP